MTATAETAAEPRVEQAQVQASPREDETPKGHPTAEAPAEPLAKVPAEPLDSPVTEGEEASDDPRMAAVIDVLRGVYDPEIPVNIYELGLIYGVEIDVDGHCEIEMTLTAPACPVAGILPPEVEYRVSQVEGIAGAHVEVVWDPPWSMERMSEAARLMLGLD